MMKTAAESGVQPLRESSRSNNNDSSSVQVAVRIRPMLPSEAGSTPCIDVSCSSSSSSTVRTDMSEKNNVVRIGGTNGPTFTFDEAFSGGSNQKQIYANAVSPLVESCLQGYNATVLAYGQTGSGKTHTIMGPSTSTAIVDDRTAGVIPRTLRCLFEKLEQKQIQAVNQSISVDSVHVHGKENDENCAKRAPYEYEVRVQFLELYGEDIRDLLSTKAERLTIRDVGMDEPEVLGATQHKVENAEEALLCLTRGMLRRVTGATAMNAESSRSHALLSVLVEQTTVIESQETNTHHQQQRQLRSKFSFVDLAGSERQKRTQATGRRLQEGININKGLLVLGNVISALGDPKKCGKVFVPYRDSKLTRLLKGSLGGNHKTLMIACVSPSSDNLDESLNCLRYANRAKNIQNNAVVNVDAGSKLVGELRAQVQALAIELLRVGDSSILVDGPFTSEILQGFAGGDVVARPSTSPGTVPATTVALSSKDGNSNSYFPVEAESNQRVCTHNREMALMGQNARTIQEDGTESFEQGPPSPVIQRARKVIDEEKAHLNDIQRALADASPTRVPLACVPLSGNDIDPDSLELLSLRKVVCQSMPQIGQVDTEAETRELEAISQKYLKRDDFDADDLQSECPQDEEENQALLENDSEVEDETFRRRRQQLEAHLLELSQSIDAKEELIEQLQVSQQKYATMREFYEEKLQEMEIQVKERELERENLLVELKSMEETNSCTRDLQRRLERKEESLAVLRRKQNELASLTKVSSRNESEINRLRNDVVSMKHKKVELQKQVMIDRKAHKTEILKLKKEATQSDRETSKWKKISDKKSSEAENSQRIAKSRLEQVGQLKAKYKEAGKRLRMNTFKRGVMRKAGLDPVLMGRRESSKQQNAVHKKCNGNKSGGAAIDVGAMRDYLDAIVADVGRREFIADKLAIAWEERIELTCNKEELVEETGERPSESFQEDADALDVQIEFKTNRIRQLTKQLGKRSLATTKMDQSPILFLHERGFKSLCKGK